ncbi:O-unit flippase-like protein [Photobacterium sp. Hal280]|uniref:O-unit flippase-like protein n=1 Tax=Photobacterium sp. Hal280 TaxID=3035163 RepID=UPI00301C8A48
MKHVVKRSDVIWGYLSQFLNISSSLLVLPFIIAFLSQEELGAWYVFVTMAGLIQLLEFGLLPTVSRFFSYVYSGAQSLKYNIIPNTSDGEINKELLVDVYNSARSIYLIISLMSLFIVLTIGNLYLYSLDTDENNVYFIQAWTMYGAAISIQLYFGYYNSLLKGRGEQTALNKIIVVTKLTFIILAIPLLTYNLGLYALSIAALFSIVVDRILVRRAVYNKNNDTFAHLLKNKIKSTKKKVIWKSARDMGLVQLGNFLTVRSGVLIVSSFVSLEAAASYGLTVQITMVLVIVSSMLFGLNLPKLNAEQLNKNKSSIKSLMKKSLVVAWGIYIAGALSMLFVGDFFLSFLSENTTLLPKYLLALYLFTALLEMNYSICASYLTTKNQVIFLKGVIISGGLIVCVSFIAAKYFSAGVIGVILAQLIVQMLYNNWKWPLVVYRDLKYA